MNFPVPNETHKLTISIPYLKVLNVRERNKELYVAFAVLFNSGTRPDALTLTPIFYNITNDSVLSLTGSGIVLYHGDVSDDWVTVYLTVMEHDGGYRELGTAIQSGIGKLPMSSLPYGAAVQAVANLFGQAMRGNKDDPLLSHMHTGLHRDRYAPGDYALRNDQIEMSLSVTTK